VSHPLRRGLRRLRRWIALSAAVLLILAAVTVAVASQLLPLIERHPDKVAAWLEQRIGQPVRISGVSARWSRRGPLLDLRDLSIGSGDSGLDIGSARLRINVYAGLLPGQPLLSLRVEGLRLELARSIEGQWQARGFYGGAGVNIEQALAQLERIGELELFDGQLVIEDRYADFDVRLDRIDARLRTLGGRFRFALQVHAEDSPPLRLVADLDNSLGSGRMHLGARQLDLPAWLQGSSLVGLGLVQGRADLDLWMGIEEGRIANVDTVAEVRSLALRRTDRPDEGPTPAATQADELSLRAHLQREGDGWRMSVPVLRMQSGDERSLSGLDLRWREDSLVLRLDQIDFAAFVHLLTVLAPLQSEVLDWLQHAEPRGRVEDLELAFADGSLRDLSAQLHDLGIDAVAARPGFSGLSAGITASGESMAVTLNAPDFTVHAPFSLVAPLPAALDGHVDLWREDGKIHVEASALRVVGPDYGLTLAGGLWNDDQGSRPSVDLRAVVDPGPITAAHRFWVINKMPPKTVEWLRTSIVDGRLSSGIVMLQGDLDDWPFAGNEGRLIARAEVDDTVFDYLPGWPMGTRLKGYVGFENQSIESEVSARVLAVPVTRAWGRIANLKQPVLELELEGGASGERLLGLLRQSPLWKRFGTAMRGLSIDGDADVRLTIRAPLKRELGELELDGQADLVDADLVDTQWGLRFGGASGRLRFTRDGFSADELGVRFDGQPGSLSLASGRFSADSAHLFEASLRGAFSVESLLALRPELHWLEPYVIGESGWSIDLAVPVKAVAGPDEAVTRAPEAVAESLPRAPASAALADSQPAFANAVPDPQPPAAAPSVLRVRSDLRGVALRLPAPLRKPADGALPLDLRFELPADQGILDLRLGRLLRLRGLTGATSAEFRGVAAFGAETSGELPAAGLNISGSTSTLDAPAWIALAMGGNGDGLRIGDIDIETGLLSLGERGLSDQRVSVHTEDNGQRRLRLQGPSAEGEVIWPAVFSEPVSVRMQRLYWPPGPEQAPGTPAKVVAEPDPTAMPALDVVIDDARFGKAHLGRLELLTRRGPDGQLVERLQTRSADLSVDIRGDWSRSLEGSESRFTIGFSGDDLGRMLQAFGMAPLVEGGKTRADMDLRWRGGPANFAFAAADGQLRITVGKGRVPELEPGAGRFLGLLSLAEIPRRLALDFSDFFRAGLAFNSIEGSFQLAGGNAMTDNLRIDGPAAEIKLSGRTGLAARDYSLQVEVLPRTGSVLPALGALTAGPAGAAVGAVAQAVLQRPMKQMNRTLYQVGGGWDAPDIEVIERGPARVEPSPLAPQRVDPDASVVPPTQRQARPR
jgi:uncharacterized protein YhdP